MGKIAIKETAFDDWFEAAERGDAFCYHNGYLPKDRDAVSVGREARAAWKAHTEKRVMLVQRRLGEFVYDYVALKV